MPGSASEVEIVIDSRARIRIDSDDAETIEEIKALFAHRNPKHYKLVGMGYKAWSEPAVIRTWAVENGVLSVPRGGAKALRGVLRRRGYTYRIVDRRTQGDPRFIGLVPDYRGHVLRDYQINARNALVKNENALLRSSTGSGKTSSLLAFAAEVKLPTLVIVWMSALYEQWIRRIAQELKMPTRDIGEIRGGVKRFGAVTVAMQQSLWNRLTPDIINFPGTLIVDEVHRAAARTLQEIVNAFPAYYRVGASDDERRTDQKEFLIYDAFGRPVQDTGYNMLADQGHVLDVEVICVPTDYMPPIAYFDDPNFQTLLDDMIHDPSRNHLAVTIAQTAATHGEQVFVMSHRVQHCVYLDEQLRHAGMKSGLLVGAPEYKKEFARTLMEMELGRIRVGVGTVQSIGTGLDLPDIAVSVVTTPIAGNETTFRQARGRICRIAKGKTGAIMYLLVDTKIYGKKHVRNLMKWSRKVSVVVENRLVSAEEWLRQG